MCEEMANKRKHSSGLEGPENCLRLLGESSFTSSQSNFRVKASNDIITIPTALSWFKRKQMKRKSTIRVMTHGLSSVNKQCSSFDSLKKGKMERLPWISMPRGLSKGATKTRQKATGKMKTIQIGMKNDWNISWISNESWMKHRVKWLGRE